MLLPQAGGVSRGCPGHLCHVSPSKAVHVGAEGLPCGPTGGGDVLGHPARLLTALLSLLQDIRAGHWIFHPVLLDDVSGRAVLSQAPGGLALHHPN